MIRRRARASPGARDRARRHARRARSSRCAIASGSTSAPTTSGASCCPYNTVAHLIGPHRISNMRVDVRAVVTHKTPNAPYRGAGRPETVFAMDRIVDCLARELRMDPAELRRRNYIRRRRDAVRPRHALSRRQPARLRQRRLSPRRSRRRSPRAATTQFRAEQAALRAARRVPRHRPLRLRRGHRHRPVRGRDREARRRRPRRRRHRRGQLGAGPRDELRPGRRRRPRRAARVGDGDRRRHRGLPLRHRNLRQPQRRDRGQLDRRRLPRRCASKLVRAAAALLEAAPDDIEIDDGRAFVRGSPGSAVDLARVVQASIPTFAKPGVASPDFEATRLSPRAHRHLGERRARRRRSRSTRATRPGDAPAVPRRPRLRQASSIPSSSRARCTAAWRRAWAARSSRRWSTTTTGQLLTGLVPRLPGADGRWSCRSIETVHLEYPSPRNPLGRQGAGRGRRHLAARRHRQRHRRRAGALRRAGARDARVRGARRRPAPGGAVAAGRLSLRLLLRLTSRARAWRAARLPPWRRAWPTRSGDRSSACRRRWRSRSRLRR